MKVFIKTFGCKINQYESENITESLSSKGFIISDNCPDIILINSCTVTARSDAKLRQFVNTSREKNPNSLIVVSGCYASVENTPMEGVIFVENDKKDSLALILSGYRDTGEINLSVPTTSSKPISNYSKHSRAFMKIQDGCESFCSYCIVPYARGEAKSLSYSSVLREAENLYGNGYREFVLTGINLGAYNSEGKRLGTLVRQMLSILPSDSRIRFSSIEPIYCEEEILSLFSEERICAHAHIPLQSGSNSVLSLMSRRYTTEKYFSIIEKIRALRKNIAITTDIMVGHPGESEDEFNTSMEFYEKVQFASTHIFRYSPRPSTPSALMTNTVSENDKIIRSRLLHKASEKWHRLFREETLGKTVEVAVEREKENGYTGLSGEYLRMLIQTKKTLAARQIVKATFTEIDGEKNRAVLKNEK